MTTWHVYTLATGLFTGQAFTGDARALESNTPPGCGARGDVADWQSQRVDLATGAVVDWQPPAPPDDAMRTWVWHAGARRWIDQPSLGALRQARLLEVQQAIEQQEAAQARPVRELLQAMLANRSAAQEARDRMQAVADEIAKLQALRAAVVAAQSEDELNQIKLP